MMGEMQLPIYQVDAFTSRLFGGNPAAIVPLEEWLPDATLQSIALENNLSETAYFVKEDPGYRIRWFTPGAEVDLCGHATLATAHVLWNEWSHAAPVIRFASKSGELVVRRMGERMELDFPARPPAETQPCPGLIEALGGEPLEVWAARDYMVIYGSEEEVRSLQPNMAGLMNIDRFAVIATATGRSSDFVSRFFAPAKGVPEDPVTGSAHCTLIPFWAKRFGKNVLHALQVSPRGGELFCELRGNRVGISGQAALYLKGTIHI
jgi:PhzF family phenazine biosynthesis protein